MKSRVFASFLAFSLLLALPAGAMAASDGSNSRYFVATTHTFWGNAMGARHVFPDGFTADLSDLQLRIAKLAGLKPIEIKKFNILSDATVTESVSPTPQPIPSQSVSWGVRTLLADPKLKSTSGGSGIRIAVLDTGIDRQHPDLMSRISGCTDYTDPAQGVVADSCDDLNGHGTHMAGILVADGGPSGAGMYGFAPQASISVYRVCDRTGICLSDDIAVAMHDAVDAGSQIIVLGMGGESQSSFVNDAIAYAAEHDVLVVAAAGNDGPYEDSLDWPARNPAVVSVGAVDNTLTPADFSSRGTNAATTPLQADEGDIEFAAPGVNIESTFLGGGYAIQSGTSMAAANIAGLAALQWQAAAEHPAQATRLVLHKIARDIAPVGDDTATGSGIPISATK